MLCFFVLNILCIKDPIELNIVTNMCKCVIKKMLFPENPEYVNDIHHGGSHISSLHTAAQWLWPFSPHI